MGTDDAASRPGCKKGQVNGLVGNVPRLAQSYRDAHWGVCAFLYSFQCFIGNSLPLVTSPGGHEPAQHLG
jgi:hypothetical protein